MTSYSPIYTNKPLAHQIPTNALTVSWSTGPTSLIVCECALFFSVPIKMPPQLMHRKSSAKKFTNC